MKMMKSCPDFLQAPPKGRYPSKIVVANPGFSKAGESHIEITTEITTGPHKGAQAYDYIGTDGTTKYGIGGKRKLRQLGIDLNSDQEIPDQVVAQQLLGLELMVEYENEQAQSKDESGKLNPRFELDANGNKVAVQRLTVVGYIRAQGAPQGQQLPQQPQQNLAPQQGGVPQGYPQGPFPGAPQAPQGFAPPPGLPQAWGGAPQQGAPAPQGWGAPPNGAPQLVQAPPGWTQPAGAPPAGAPTQR